MVKLDAKTLIDNYAEEAARQSALPEPERTEARHELASHLYETAREIAGTGEPTSEDAIRAIKALGTRNEVHRAFFGPYAHAHADARWGRRVGAFAVDVVIMLIVTTFLLGFFVDPVLACDDREDTRLCVIVNVPGPVSFRFAEPGPEVEDPTAFHVGFIHGLHSWVTSAAFLAYFIVLETAWGRTVGKHVFHIRVRSADGPLPTFLQATGRNLTKVVFPLLLLDWLLGWAANGAKRQRVSDILAKTRVTLP